MIRRWGTAVATAAVLAAAACGPAAPRPHDGAGAQAGAPQVSAPTAPPDTARQPPPENDRRDGQGHLIAREEDPEGEPAVIRIPAVGVDAPMVRLDLTPDGGLEVPQRFHTAGWYTGAPAPGYVGPAVIAGHVDSVSGPAVFHRLAEMQPGQQIHVDYDDGRRATFVVQRLERHPKDEFPTRQVYGNTDRPALRLITCGGSFDASSGHYRDNVIVYATAPDRRVASGRSG